MKSNLTVAIESDVLTRFVKILELKKGKGCISHFVEEKMNTYVNMYDATHAQEEIEQPIVENYVVCAVCGAKYNLATIRKCPQCGMDPNYSEKEGGKNGDDAKCS